MKIDDVIIEGLVEAEKTAKVFHPQYVDVYFLDGPRRTPLLVNRKVPYNLIDRYLEVAIKKYNLQKGRFEFRNAEEDPVAEGSLEEIDRRGFLKGMGAAAVAGDAMAQLSPDEKAKYLKYLQQDVDRYQREYIRKKEWEEEQAKRDDAMRKKGIDPYKVDSPAPQNSISSSYAGRIQARIQPNITFSGTGSGPVGVEIRVAPDGTILSRKIIKSSGDAKWDDAIIRGIDKTMTLPQDIDGRAPPTVSLTLGESVEQGVAEGEGNLKEFSPSGAGPSGGNYFQALASAWYNGAFDTGSLQKGIKSKVDVERLLQRGIVCPDGVTRKFGIDYNAEFDGVVISSDDYYEHSDHGKKPGTMIDVRTGQAWGPYDYMEFSDSDLSESLTEFAPIKPPTAGAFGGNKDYGQPTSSRYIGPNKFVLGTTNNYILTATVDKWGLEWDEDDEIWFLDSPGAVYIADATEGEIELPAPQEQRNQIHDLVTDYLNDHNSAELQRVAAYYGHSADGEMATSEGIRVANQQIPGTKNRAQSAYYPTNVKPKVPKLANPLTDQELARLAQLAGIKDK